MQAAKKLKKNNIERYHHKSNNAMNTSRKPFHARTKFLRRCMSIKSKLMNHKDAAFKRTCTTWQEPKVKSKHEVIEQAQQERKTVQSATFLV